MFINHTLSKLAIIIVIISMTIVACSKNSENQENTLSKTVLLDVYKRAQCGCCGNWVSHVKENGFRAVIHNQNDLSDIKEKWGIHPKLRSCHTSVTKDGFVFEGHIPAKFIQQFLDEKPEGSFGLAVPAMPTGSPGMEFGNRFMPYKIYLLKTDGTIENYAEVNSAKEQF